jgi:serine O-acetyltransferase
VMPAIDTDKQRASKRHPTLADNVIVGAGAQILGPITVHRCARVGGNSVVTRDVPEGATVVGVPARQMTKGAGKSAPTLNFSPYAVPDDRESDPRERTIAALVDEVQNQRARLAALEEQLVTATMSATASKPASKTTSRRSKTTS